MRMRICGWIPSILILLVGAAPAASQTVTDPALWIQTTQPAIGQATAMRFLAPGDAFVLEQKTGKVFRVQGTTVTEVLDLDVRSNSERGLIGLALHPDFATNDFVYLYYSVPLGQGDDSSGGNSDTSNWAQNRLSRFTWNGTNLVNETPLFSIDFDAAQNNGANHDGGVLRFGPDGKLYLATGDLHRNRAEQNRSSQASTSAKTGGIYRLNDDGTIPTDNPFYSHTNPDFRPLYAYGIRNSFGMAFDPVSGDLWNTENGPSDMDEVNRVAPGFNSGWRLIMGPDSRDSSDPDDLVDLSGTSTYSDPEFSFDDTIGVTAILFLSGSALGSAYDDAVLVADAYGRSGEPDNGTLYLFRLNGSRDGFVLNGDMADLVEDNGDDLSQILFGEDFGPIADLQIDPDGFVRVLSLNGDNHRIALSLPCDNGVDDDSDGLIDYGQDPGCASWSGIEDAQCQNGINDDGLLGTDFDGGASVGVNDPDGGDPNCFDYSDNKEAASSYSCGLGVELALLLPLLMAAGTRRRGTGSVRDRGPV
jgi:glucose/arabinose dehydrogenase